jgi:hypothetical protein
MSKLATILQARTLPAVQKNVLFSNCQPEKPDMFNVLVTSWQNSGVFPIVPVQQDNQEPDSKVTETQVALEPITNNDQEQAQEQKITVAPAPIDDTVDEPWISRLADEWQVGIDTLVPLTWQSPMPAKTFTRRFDTICDTIAETTESERAPMAYLVEKILEAIETRTTSTVEQVLHLINRQSQSSVAILIELKNHLLKNSTTPITVDWETGNDSTGKTFTRLNICIMNDCSKGSGSTKLVIGSDSTTYATFTERWNSKPIFLSPDDAIKKISVGNQFGSPAANTVLQQKNELMHKRISRQFRASGF